VENIARLFADVLPITISSVSQGGIAASQQSLNQKTRDFHRMILRRFLETGKPPTVIELADLATACGCFLDDGINSLVQADLLQIDGERGHVVVAYPLSAIETAHVVSSAAYPSIHAMCAIDALGVLSMSKCPGSVTSVDPVTGTSILAAYDGEQWAWTPKSASVLLAAEIGCCGPISAACSFTAFYESAESAVTGLSTHGDVCGRVLTQDEAEQMALLEFGPLLDETND
jgi:hypothetical protein